MGWIVIPSQRSRVAARRGNLGVYTTNASIVIDSIYFYSCKSHFYLRLRGLGLGLL